MLKIFLKKIVSLLVQNEKFWTFFDQTILVLVRYAEKTRNAYKYAIINEALTVYFSDLIVRNGVFKGLRYPAAKAAGSVFVPKILGSYERELQPILKRICREKKTYSEIINVGCGEGYYAVGLALMFPSATVFAYDIDDVALMLCEQMAALNKVERRIKLSSFCDYESLKNINIDKKALLICDCEGYEKILFSEVVNSDFIKYDMIIEIHDFIDKSISKIIKNSFCKSHYIEIISSVPDTIKPRLYKYKELDNYTYSIKKVLLSENRPDNMQWFYLKSKQ
jgi:hypothetical protein